MSACVFHCLSRIPVQRHGAGDGGGPGPGSAAAAPRAGGRELLLPASLRPADVHHAHAVQQENCHQRQGQRNRRGQGRLPVSLFTLHSFIISGSLTQCLSVTGSFMLAEGASAVGVSGYLWVTFGNFGFCCILLCNYELKYTIRIY